ncbi:hypothetical protein GY45DRAFT_1341467 [Cubamyces sp. BRFM 1775]|nr:hypothetical protein GY45DRAFT_1341467 [Cubamyces sp. BRFM 1775]
MHTWTIFCIVFCLHLLPLFIAILPYAILCQYTVELSLEASAEHVARARGSVKNAAMFAICLLMDDPSCLQLSRGTEPANDRTILPELGLVHQLYFDQIITHIPRLHILSPVLSIERAAHSLATDAALGICDLSKDGGEIHAISKIASHSSTLFGALCNVIAHVELSIARVSFVHATALASVALLDELSLHGLFPYPNLSRVDDFAEISVDAFRDSINSTLAEVDHAMSVTSEFLEQLQNLRVDRYFGGGAPCSSRTILSPSERYNLRPNSTAPPTASENLVVLQDHSILSIILDGLFELRESLQDGLSGLSDKVWRLVVHKSWPLPNARYMLQSQQYIFFAQAMEAKFVRRAAIEYRERVLRDNPQQTSGAAQRNAEVMENLQITRHRLLSALSAWLMVSGEASDIAAHTRFVARLLSRFPSPYLSDVLGNQGKNMSPGICHISSG